MHRKLSDKEQKEIRSIISAGEYKRSRNSKEIRVHIEHISLAFLKYLSYAEIKSWRCGFVNDFIGGDECGLTKGRRAAAIKYLTAMKIVAHIRGRHWGCLKETGIADGIVRLERIIKKEKEGK